MQPPPRPSGPPPGRLVASLSGDAPVRIVPNPPPVADEATLDPRPGSPPSRRAWLVIGGLGVTGLGLLAAAAAVGGAVLAALAWSA